MKTTKLKKEFRKFNNCSNTYDKKAVIQKKLAKKLLEEFNLKNILESLPKKPKILELGCGTGILTELLVKLKLSLDITAVDIAPKMLACAKKKPSLKEINFLNCDAENLPKFFFKNKEYDLIISNATFQWFKKPFATIQKLTKLLKPNGNLIFSTFGNLTFKELITTFKEVEKKMQLRPSLHHLPLKNSNYWIKLLQNLNFEVERKEILIQETYPNCRNFLQTIKATGASFSKNNLPFNLTKKLILEVLKTYDKKYIKEKNKVYATYHFILINATPKFKTTIKK